MLRQAIIWPLWCDAPVLISDLFGENEQRLEAVAASPPQPLPL